MEEVFITTTENKNKAEDLLRKDDLVGRQSITIRLASALGFKEDGHFIIINGSEESIKKSHELLKNIAKKYEKKGDVIKKLEEEEGSAMEGLGNILG